MLQVPLHTQGIPLAHWYTVMPPLFSGTMRRHPIPLGPPTSPPVPWYALRGPSAVHWTGVGNQQLANWGTTFVIYWDNYLNYCNPVGKRKMPMWLTHLYSDYEVLTRWRAKPIDQYWGNMCLSCLQSTPWVYLLLSQRSFWVSWNHLYGFVQVWSSRMNGDIMRRLFFSNKNGDSDVSLVSKRVIWGPPVLGHAKPPILWETDAEWGARQITANCYSPCVGSTYQGITWQGGEASSSIRMVPTFKPTSCFIGEETVPCLEEFQQLCKKLNHHHHHS